MSGELVIGASGLIGSYLLSHGRKEGARIHGTYLRHPAPGLRQLDITDAAAVTGLLGELRPDIVYLPAATPNVEWVEEHPEESRRVNVDAPLRIVGLLKNSPAKLVYYSSDYVFDGAAGPYVETDRPNPLCEYARQKLAVEQAIAAGLSNWLVFRATVVFGWETQGKNYVVRAVASLRQGQPIDAPRDQYGNPSYAPNVAAASRVIANSGAAGTFHLAGTDVCNRYEFALEIARTFGADESLVRPVDTSSLRQKARRPMRAGMIVRKAQSLLPFPLLGYRQALRAMKQEEGLVHA